MSLDVPRIYEFLKNEGIEGFYIEPDETEDKVRQTNELHLYILAKPEKRYARERKIRFIITPDYLMMEKTEGKSRFEDEYSRIVCTKAAELFNSIPREMHDLAQK